MMSSSDSDRLDNAEKVPTTVETIPTSNEAVSNISHSLAFRAMMIFQVLAYGSYSVLVHLCEQNRRIKFSSTTMNFTIELFKLCFSLIAQSSSSNANQLILRRKGTWFRRSLPYSIPGLLYFINNNLAVYIQLQMDPASYQILSNFKIVTTAILYRLIIRQKLTRRQWLAISLLFFGGFFYSLGTINTSMNNTRDGYQRMYIRPLGLPMISIYCIVSGLAGVYNEWILKEHYSESLHQQNIYLYTYGMILNLIPAIGIPFYSSSTFHMSSLYQGFSVYTWLIVGTQALNGLFMSVVIKHTSNIVRLFVIAFALIVTTVLSIVFLSLTLNPLFVISFVAMMGALYLYYYH